MKYKFHPGDLVKVTHDLTITGKLVFGSDKEWTITKRGFGEQSIVTEMSNGQTGNQYGLLFSDGDKTAWYDEEDLELIENNRWDLYDEWENDHDIN